MIVDCAYCGKLFDSPARNIVTCPECREFGIPCECEECGRKFRTPISRSRTPRRFCSDRCRYQNAKKMAEKGKKDTTKKPKYSIDDICKARNELGLPPGSYYEVLRILEGRNDSKGISKPD